MNRPWVKPSFQDMSVGGECTAYAGAVRVSSGRDRGLAAGPEPGDVVAPPSRAVEKPIRPAIAAITKG
jgi:hypothetical protein